MSLHRRSFAGTALAGLLAGCAQGGAESVRLHARAANPATTLGAGTHPLHLRRERDTLLYIPQSASESLAPLLVYFHGATGSEQQGIKRLSPFADEFGFLLLSPASADGTWDAIQDDYGADVRLIDRALARAFASRHVDPRRIAFCGFSDGASYALGLAIANGDLCTKAMAFSPGFIPGRPRANGRPALFVSHGTNDQILPIETCSRRLVPQLKKNGYDVTYREFPGPHTVPPDITRQALQWFLG